MWIMKPLLKLLIIVPWIFLIGLFGQVFMEAFSLPVVLVYPDNTCAEVQYADEQYSCESLPEKYDMYYVSFDYVPTNR